MSILFSITIYFVYHGSCCTNTRKFIQLSNHQSNRTFLSYYVNDDGLLTGTDGYDLIKMNLENQEIIKSASLNRVNDLHTLQISPIAGTNYLVAIDGNTKQINLKLYDTTTFNQRDIKTVIYCPKDLIRNASLSTLDSNILILWTMYGDLFYSLWKLQNNALQINVNTTLLFDNTCFTMANNPQTLLIASDETNQLFHIVYVVSCSATGDKVIAQTINVNGAYSDQNIIHYVSEYRDDFYNIRFLEFIKTLDDMFIIPWCGTVDNFVYQHESQQCWIHIWFSTSSFYSNSLDSYDKYALTYFLDGYDTEWEDIVSLSSMAVIEGENIYKSYIFYAFYLDDAEVKELQASIVNFNGTVLYKEIILNECTDTSHICDFSVKSHENQFIIVYTYCGDYNWYYKTIDINNAINGDCDFEYSCTPVPTTSDVKNSNYAIIVTAVVIVVIVVVVLAVIVTVIVKFNYVNNIWKQLYPTKKKCHSKISNKSKDNTRHVAKYNSNKQLEEDVNRENQTVGDIPAYVAIKPTSPEYVDDEVAMSDLGNTNKMNIRNVEDEGEHLLNVEIDEITKIKRWFEEEVGVDNEGNQYYELFIENGFEKLHLIKYITDLELKEIGVNKMGHRKAILIAAKKL